VMRNQADRCSRKWLVCQSRHQLLDGRLVLVETADRPLRQRKHFACFLCSRRTPNRSSRARTSDSGPMRTRRAYRAARVKLKRFRNATNDEELTKIGSRDKRVIVLHRAIGDAKLTRAVKRWTIHPEPPRE